jgi:peptide/nickel transport system substrate-binding protein
MTRKPGIARLGIAMLVAMSALAPAQAADKVMRAVPQLEVRILDPFVNTNYGTRNHGHLIYETLFALDSKRDPKPQMVGDWSVSPDKLVWRFTLREGLRWHDGKPVTAADCIASLNRFMKKDGLGSKLAAATGSLVAEGDTTIVLTLKQPFALVLDALAKPSGYAAFMMPERFANLPDGSPQFEPIGSGPFIFRKDLWQPGNRSIYERNKDYKPRSDAPDGMAGAKIVKLDRVEMISMPDVNTAANALAAGEVDWIESLAFDVLPQMKSERDIVVRPTDLMGNQPYLRMNHLHPPFNNVKARQALLYIMDQDLYGQAITGDKSLYTVCPAFLMCGSTYGSTAGAIKPDLEKARALMKEAGYAGEKIILLEPTNHPAFDAATLMTASQLRKIGVNVELQGMDYNAMLTRRNKKEPPAQGGWHLSHSANFGVDVASPMTNVYLASNCEQAAAGWPCDKEIEQLKDEFARAPSLEERKAIAEKIQLRAMETVPYVPVLQTPTMMAHRKGITNIAPAPMVVYWGVDKGG